MTSEDSEGPTVSKLVSVPGLAALVILGIAILALSRLFGAETILREVVTEVVAGFGNAILILAIFGLFFRSGLERVLRRAPGGDTLAESAERLREILQDLDQNNRGMGESQLGATLDHIEEDVHSLLKEEVPELKREVKEMRRLMLDAGYGR
jgi:iron-sulfur cluster repair protein YtfE (RIC family)